MRQRWHRLLPVFHLRQTQLKQEARRTEIPKGAPRKLVLLEVEDAILDGRLQHPTHRYLWMAQQLASRNIEIGSGQWERGRCPESSQPVTNEQWLMRLETSAIVQWLDLSPEQIRWLERFKQKYREGYIKTRFANELIVADSFVVRLAGSTSAGTILGVPFQHYGRAINESRVLLNDQAIDQHA